MAPSLFSSFRRTLICVNILCFLGFEGQCRRPADELYSDVHGMIDTDYTLWGRYPSRQRGLVTVNAGTIGWYILYCVRPIDDFDMAAQRHHSDFSSDFRMPLELFFCFPIVLARNCLLGGIIAFRLVGLWSFRGCLSMVFLLVYR